MSRASAWLRGRGRPDRDVELLTGATVPGLVLRLAAGVWATLALVVAWSSPGPHANPALVVLLAVLVGALVARPAEGTGGVLVLAVGLRVVVGDPLTWPAVAALVLLVHLLLATVAHAARAGWRTRVELAVLAVGRREVVLVQVGAQVLAALAVALLHDGPGLGDLVRVGALGLAGAVLVVVLPRRDGSSGQDHDRD